MAQNNDATAAAQYENIDEQTRADYEYEAWSQVADEFRNENAELYNRLDSADAWDGMELEVYKDDNGRKYFHKITGVEYAPGHENGKQLSEAAHEFLNEYRSRLSDLIQG